MVFTVPELPSVHPERDAEKIAAWPMPERPVVDPQEALGGDVTKPPRGLGNIAHHVITDVGPKREITDLEVSEGDAVHLHCHSLGRFERAPSGEGEYDAETCEGRVAEPHCADEQLRRQ